MRCRTPHLPALPYIRKAWRQGSSRRDRALADLLSARKRYGSAVLCVRENLNGTTTRLSAAGVPSRWRVTVGLGRVVPLPPLTQRSQCQITRPDQPPHFHHGHESFAGSTTRPTLPRNPRWGDLPGRTGEATVKMGCSASHFKDYDAANINGLQNLSRVQSTRYRLRTKKGRENLPPFQWVS